MSGADNFLWTILESPDDDFPRLAFADWLEEHGEQAHADFIRLQCLLAVHPKEDDLWLERKVREEELWQDLRERRRDVLADLKLDRFGVEDFRRGFLRRPMHLRIGEMGVVARAEGRWTFFLGIDSLETFCHATAAFFASPQMRRVASLNCQRSGVTDETLRPFAASQDFGRLKVLDLFRNDIGPAGAQALVSCPSLTGLTDLRLDENHLGDAGAELLAASPVCRSLTRLELFENGIGDAGVIALSRSPHLASLRCLRLHGNRFGAVGLEALAGSPYLTRLEELALGGPEGFESCIPALRQLFARVGRGFDSWSEYDE
jgi:uncharacterized protein (TIGR02996 family)